MKNRSDKYISIYTKYREDREKELSDLRKEVYEVKRLVEYLCKKVFE